MTDNEAFTLLGITAKTPFDEARKAYLTLLKSHRPEQDPRGFQNLRQAWETCQRRFEAASPPKKAPPRPKSPPKAPTPPPVPESVTPPTPAPEPPRPPRSLADRLARRQPDPDDLEQGMESVVLGFQSQKELPELYTPVSQALLRLRDSSLLTHWTYIHQWMEVFHRLEPRARESLRQALVGMRRGQPLDPHDEALKGLGSDTLRMLDLCEGALLIRHLRSRGDVGHLVPAALAQPRQVLEGRGIPWWMIVVGLLGAVHLLRLLIDRHP